MSDYISREEATAVFKKHQSHMATHLWEYEQDMNAIPSADVRENIHGEWIAHDTEHLGYFIECSNCNSAFGAYLPYKHFCPNCGADMRGE